MSNQDSNGIELPWILHEEMIFPDPKSDKESYRSKIIPNPLWSHNSISTETFAIMSCFHQAIVNMDQKAGKAMLLHLQDAWQWREK